MKMFKKIDSSIRKRKEELDNMTLRERITNAEANLDYLSMVSGIEVPEDESNPNQEDVTKNE